jgi:transposase
MIGLNRRTKVFFCKESTDMRASFDSLFFKVKDHLKEDPFSGHLFVFLNKSRSTCKALLYDGTGLIIIAKRLENGLFSSINPHFPGKIVLTQAEFSLFLEGASLNKRFIESPSEVRRGPSAAMDEK